MAAKISAIERRHPQYAGMLERWGRCRDLFEGEDAVKAAGVKYLPALEGAPESSNEYRKYLQRAMLFPAFERTVESLAGLLFRREPTREWPGAIETHRADVTLTAQPLNQFLQAVVTEQLTTGRLAVTVDWSEVEARPYWRLYIAEDLTNWSEARIGGRNVTTRLVFREFAWELDPDGATVQTVQYREFVLMEPGTDGAYVRVNVWRKVSAKPDAEYAVAETLIPMKQGKALRVIPAVVINARSVGLAVEKPLLLDLVNVNISHYRSSADLEHGRHFVALPTPWITGYGMPGTMPMPGMNYGNGDPVLDVVAQPSQPVLAIGAGTCWTIPNPDAKVGMLEFTGAGLSELRMALEQKEKTMAVLGSRILERQPSTQETAEAVRARQAGSASALERVADVAGVGFSLVSRLHAFWMGRDEALKDEKITVALNKDFFESKLTPQELEALVSLAQAGHISSETLYWNLQQGEVTRPGVSFEEEREVINAEEDAKPEPDDPAEGLEPGAGLDDEGDDEALSPTDRALAIIAQRGAQKPSAKPAVKPKG